MSPEGSKLMRLSFDSLVATAPKAEIIVCDNGGSYDDSEYFLRLCDQGAVASYTRYRENQHFYYARNDGLRRASRPYIALSDNDILFSDGWLEECVAWLKATSGKYIATPLAPDPMNRKSSRWTGEVDGWKTNSRAGSNCFVVRREDFESIGYFDAHHVAGSLWCDRYVRMGYTVGVMPTPKATDLGLRKGYHIKEKITRYAL